MSTAKVADSAVTTAKINDSAVTTAKINDGAVTSAKLAEAFFRGRYQADTTNSQPTGLTVQFGWGHIQGDNSGDLSETLTFPTAFSSAPVVILNPIGVANSSPSDITSFNQTVTDSSTVYPHTIAASSCTVAFNKDTGQYSNTKYFGYTWLAIGEV